LPRVGVAALPSSVYPGRVREAGAEPVLIPLPEPSFPGVALRREWTADSVEMRALDRDLDGLLLSAARPEVLAGLVLAALRLDLPAVVAGASPGPLSAALCALGLAPLAGDPAGTAVELACNGEPTPGELVDGFSLADALRLGCAVGGGPELLVHLAAIGREAGESGFDKTLRVLAPEMRLVAPPDSEWFREHGLPGVLVRLGDALHDSRTVAGYLKDDLPQAVPEPPEAPAYRLAFVEDGREVVEAVAWASDTRRNYASGSCRVFTGEEAAVRAVEEGEIQRRDALVVAGCGPRVAPGLLRLTRLAAALETAGLSGQVPVFTDGLAPDSARGVWASLAASGPGFGGLLARLRDGDRLYVGLNERVVRLGVPTDELRDREPLLEGFAGRAGYRVRYARSALSALQGAGFGSK
jgi:dihydroxy-acid dehydratase